MQVLTYIEQDFSQYVFYDKDAVPKRNENIKWNPTEVRMKISTNATLPLGKPAMSGKERFMTALSNQMPDRMPCQVHSWMKYYLDTYLNGIDQFDAYEYFGMDPVIYVGPDFQYDPHRLSDWQIRRRDLGVLCDGYHHWEEEIVTPGGSLFHKGAWNQYTGWETEHLIKSPQDFDLWEKFCPRPVSVDWSNVLEAKRKIGDRGIVRGSYYDFGQCSPWQSFASVLYGTEQAIFACFDDPSWVHYVLESLLKRKLDAIDLGGKQQFDLIECGGGGGSSTVISPAMHREFCLPYDKIQIEAFHSAGTKVVYHLCGGLMPLLETVVENGADALETMTPVEMGGDCILDQAAKRVGNQIAFIGGFDQNKGFEQGSPLLIREMVQELFVKKPKGGFICSPSDHFFFGDPENIKAFVEAARECIY